MDFLIVPDTNTQHEHVACKIKQPPTSNSMFTNAYAEDIEVKVKEKVTHKAKFPPINMLTNPKKIYQDDAQVTVKVKRNISHFPTNQSDWKGKEQSDKISVLKQLEFGDSTSDLVQSIWPNTRRVGLKASVTGCDNPNNKRLGWGQKIIGGEMLKVDGLDSENTVDTIVTKVSQVWDLPKPSIIIRADGVRKKLDRNTLLSKLPVQQKYFVSLEPPPVEKNRPKKKEKGEKWHQGGTFTGTQYVTKQFATGLRYVALRTPPIVPKKKKKKKKVKWNLPTTLSNDTTNDRAETASSTESIHVAGQRHAGSWTTQDCADAARDGDLEGLQNARGDGAKWDLKSTAAAAEAGNLEILEFLRANGCPWNEDTAAAAAAGGQLNILQYCREGGCPWDSRVCDSAAGGGHIHILEWAEQNRGKWTEWTCAKAAENGQLETLKWLRAKKCPWDKRTLMSAAKNNHMEVLEYAVVHHCPQD